MTTLERIAEIWKTATDCTREIPNVGRNNLPALFRDLGFREGVEVGTERGVYAEILAAGNPEGHLTCVDPWTAYRGYRDHVTQEKLDRFYAEAAARLKPYNVTLLRKFSRDAVLDFERDSLDYVYIDGNHEFSHVAFDLVEWTKRVKPGGIIAGHDYKTFKNQCYSHVVATVQGYVLAYRIRPWFVLGTQAVVEGQIRDGARSFMWVKA